MSQNPDEDTKAAKQAWRRKPRQFAPKSRLGCKTCKIRRVKCDLTQPSCLKCQSTGRTCDGYPETPTTPMPNDRDFAAPTTRQAEQWELQHRGLRLQHVQPFMVFPDIGSVHTEAMGLFESISVKNLNEYQLDESWSKTLMYFSQTEPSVRHAAMALGLLHRNYLAKDSTERVYKTPGSGSERLHDRMISPLMHYNKAIKLLLDKKPTGNAQNTIITLLVCYLFTCFDHLARHDTQAMQHLRGGVELTRNIERALRNGENVGRDSSCAAQEESSRTLIRQIIRQIRRLDTQAVMFLLDWTPASIQETPVTQISLPMSFDSLTDAADHLHILIAWVLQVCNGEEQMYPTENVRPACSSLILKGIILEQLGSWLKVFEHTFQQGESPKDDSETSRVATLLRLQHTMAWTFLSGYGPGREMEYDKFLPQFQVCVAMANDVATAHEHYSGSLNPTFTPEIGLLPVLYIIGAKCRDPLVRRKVLSILRRQPMREAVWDSVWTAKVLETIIEIEEGGFEDGVMAQSMEQIAVWQRIEAISWVHVPGPGSSAKLDLTYTFCMREGVHTESLPL